LTCHKARREATSSEKAENAVLHFTASTWLIPIIIFHTLFSLFSRLFRPLNELKILKFLVIQSYIFFFSLSYRLHKRKKELLMKP